MALITKWKVDVIVILQFAIVFCAPYIELLAPVLPQVVSNSSKLAKFAKTKNPRGRGQCLPYLMARTRGELMSSFYAYGPTNATAFDTIEKHIKHFGFTSRAREKKYLAEEMCKYYYDKDGYPRGTTTGDLARSQQKRNKVVPLNVMLMGGSGLGKTSCMNNLFDSPVIERGATKTKDSRPRAHEKTWRTPGQKDGLSLVVYDTVGYGSPGTDYATLHGHNIATLKMQARQEHLNRISGRRIGSNTGDLAHAQIDLVLYFFAPNRGSMTDALELERLIDVMEHSRVAVIFAKADTLNDEERTSLRKLFNESLAYYVDKRKDSSKNFLKQFVQDPLDHTGQPSGLYWHPDTYKIWSPSLNGMPYVCLCEDRTYRTANITWSIKNENHSDFPLLTTDIFRAIDYDTNGGFEDDPSAVYKRQNKDIRTELIKRCSLHQGWRSINSWTFFDHALKIAMLALILFLSVHVMKKRDIDGSQVVGEAMLWTIGCATIGTIILETALTFMYGCELKTGDEIVNRTPLYTVETRTGSNVLGTSSEFWANTVFNYSFLAVLVWVFARRLF